MKICVFSDIHGNIEAFDKMISNETGNVDAYIFAGDIWGYFYDQSEIIDRLSAITNLYAVKGNHDEYYLGREITPELINKYGSSYLADITDKQLGFIKGLTDHLEIMIDGKRFGIYHGGNVDFLEQRIYPDTEIDETFLIGKYDYLILGHTHYRMCRRIKDTMIINPGSLGQPRDGHGFSYCILDTKTGRIDFKSVDIDIDKLLSMSEIIDGEKDVYKYLKGKYKETR